MFVIGGSLIFGLPLPLTALQIIWINLFTDSLPALSFAYEENIDKEKKLAHEKKVIFTREFNLFTLGLGILNALFMFILYFVLIKIGLSEELARSIFFTTFAASVLVLAFSYRSLKKPLFTYKTFTNKRLNMSVLVGAGLLLFTLVSPFMREVFDIDKLPLSWLPLIALWLVFNVLIVEGAKYIFRSYHTWFPKRA